MIDFSRERYEARRGFLAVTATLEQEYTGTIHSHCICMWCPACEFFIECESDDKCGECGAICEYKDYGCEGSCYDYAKEDFERFFDEWATFNGADYYAIYGSNMGWMHKAGHTGRLDDFAGVLDSLMLDADFTLYWKLSADKKTLSITRGSHDEYGAYFEVRPWVEGDDE